MTYEVPHQDLRIDLAHMPTQPASGFSMRQVRATGTASPVAAVPSAAAAGCPFHAG
jgi:hypothetical protein